VEPRVTEHENESREQLQQALGDAYLIERELGRGGMATVYLAHDRKHDRLVALKVLHPDLGAALGPERFRREIHLAAGLQHPHILPVFDSGDGGGRLWYTMPYVAGESLRDRLVRERQLPVDEAVRIVREAAQGLHHAHRHGVVHRDVKPENILLTEDGTTLVADFGIARAMAGRAGSGTEGATQLTGTGLAVGTPAYMSPEQGAGERDIDARSDVYSLGAVLYELLAGEPPFTGATPQAILAKRFATPAPSIRVVRAGVSADLETVVMRALATAPADRFSSAADFGAALGTAVGAASGAQSSAMTAPHTRAARRWSLIAVPVVLVALGVTSTWWLRGRSPAGAPSASPEASLAVLPFENLGDSSDAYFADGITDEVRGKLAGLRQLRVIASASSRQYHKTTKSPTEIARDLGVRYLLVGRVRWQKHTNTPSRVRVDPELVDVTGGPAPATKWQQPFDAELSDVFRVQSEIAERVAGALDVALQSGEREQLAQAPTASFEAYNLFLRGRQRADEMTPEGVTAALVLYDSAVALDPTFAVAHAERYSAHAVFYLSYWDRTDRRRSLAQAALQNALRLAPDDPYVQVAAAQDAMVDRNDLADALQRVERVLRRHPNSAEAWIIRAYVLWRRGAWDDGLASMRRVVELDPHTGSYAGQAATCHFCARRYTDAERYSELAVTLNPSTPSLFTERAYVQAVLGADTARARRTLQDAIRRFGVVRTLSVFPNAVLFEFLTASQQDSLASAALPRGSPDESEQSRKRGYYWWRTAFFRWRGDSTRSRTYADSARRVVEVERRARANDPSVQLDAADQLAFLYAVLGLPREALREIQRAVASARSDNNAPELVQVRTHLARIYTMVGDQEKAIDELTYLLSVPSEVSRSSLQIDPKWAALRGHPRFAALLARSTH
jgi:serine/threonine-protein kinase